MERIFAHRIVCQGQLYRNHVAELNDDGVLRFFPFEREIPMTRFYSGTVELVIFAGRLAVRPIADYPREALL